MFISEEEIPAETLLSIVDEAYKTEAWRSPQKTPVVDLVEQVSTSFIKEPIVLKGEKSLGLRTKGTSSKDFLAKAKSAKELIQGRRGELGIDQDDSPVNIPQGAGQPPMETPPTANGRKRAHSPEDVNLEMNGPGNQAPQQYVLELFHGPTYAFKDCTWAAFWTQFWTLKSDINRVLMLLNFAHI